MTRTRRLLSTCVFSLSFTLLAAAPSVAQELEQLCPCDQLPATVFVAGQVDNYAQPTDPTSRGAQLNAAFPSNIWKHFDDSTNNAHVGHTFANLPRDIICAQLEIHLKPASFGDNDTLYLGLLPPPAPQGQFAWAIRLKDLPGTGGGWSPPLDPPPFILDLGALQANSTSPLTSLIAKLNQDGRLDLLVQDDTVVDWVKLTVRAFPQQTITVGLTDNFAPPTEATSRGTQLNAAYPLANWKDLDDTRANRFIGHTFGNLTGSVVQASLELGVKGHADVPGNDVLYLGLNSGPTWAFSAGVPSLGNNPTIDLTGLLAKINSDDRLDLLIQDDSAADYLQLRYRTCPAGRRFQGVPVSLAGDATLESTPLGEVVLGGLDSEGQDVAEFDIGLSQGICLFLQDACPLGWATGSALALGVQGNTYTQQLNLGTLVFQQGLAGVQVVSGFPNPAAYQCSYLQICDEQGNVLAETCQPDGPVAVLDAASCIKEVDYVSFGPNGSLSGFSILFDGPTSITLANGSTAIGTRLKVFEEYVLGFGRPPSPVFLDSFQVTGTQLPPVRLGGAKVQMFDLFHGALGAATLEARIGALTVTDLGSSGQDGIAISEPGVNAIHASLAPIDPQDTAEAGAFVHAEAFGELNGLADQSLGTLAVTKTDTAATPFEVSADFSAIASPTQHVQLLRNGQVVVDVAGSSGPAALSSRWPSRIGKLGGETECYVQRFPPDTLFRIAGGGAEDLAGDELRILAESQTATVGLKSELQLKAAGIPELTLTDVATGTDDGCEPGPDRLCLRGGRFALEATFATPNGDRGQAQAISLTDDTGYFWFFNPNNVEVVVKALNGCPVNNGFWVFSAGLTNVEVDLRVTDTVTGEVKHYLNPLATAYAPQLDTAAFATCSEGAANALAEPASAGGLIPKADSLLLNGDRFRVEVSWRTNQGGQGAGMPVALTSDTGYFWFFNAANVEVVVKVLNGCGVNGRYWVFAAGLTNVEVVMTVTDTVTGAVKTYTNPLGQPFLPIQDTGAFSCSP